MPASEFETALIRECRETATLLATRSQCIKDRIGHLLQWVCASDAVLDRLADLAGPEARRLLQQHQAAVREFGRDTELQRVLSDVDRTWDDATDLEGLCEILERSGSKWEEETPGQSWGMQLLDQLERTARQPVPTRQLQDSLDGQPLPLPKGAVALFGCLARSLVTRQSALRSLRLEILQEETGIRLRLWANGPSAGADPDPSLLPYDSTSGLSLLTLAQAWWAREKGELQIYGDPTPGGAVLLEGRWPHR